jgi:hypothetical protein
MKKMKLGKNKKHAKEQIVFAQKQFNTFAEQVKIKLRKIIAQNSETKPDGRI